MLISIDGQEYPNLPGEGRTLGQVLDEVKDVVAERGKIIVGIECDGQEVPPDQVDQSLTEHADKYWQINFQTVVPATLAAEVLKAARNTLRQIDRDSQVVAERLNQSQIKEAMEVMGSLFGFWSDVYRAVFHTMQLLKIEAEGIELANGTADMIMSRLHQQLRDVKTTLENRDYVQLADLLSYELIPLATEWQKLVDILLGKLTENTS